MKKGQKPRKVFYIVGIIVLVLCVTLAAGFVKWRQNSRTGITIQKLQVCHLTNPLGLDEDIPVFSWQMESSERGSCQKAYRIMVAQGKEELERKEYVWDSGKVEKETSTGIFYEGKDLTARSRYYWQVEVWDEQGKRHRSTEEAWFETGLMGEGMSQACWISVSEEENKADYEEDELIYNISYRMEIENTTAGFLFGAMDGRYGAMYLCQIKNYGEQPCFRLMRMENNIIPDEADQEIAIATPENGKSFAVRLEVNGENLKVCLNEEEVGNFQIEKTPVGSVGYYKSRGVSYAWLDDLLVEDGQGNVIYAEDFEKENTIFDPYYVSVEGGRLKVGSGLMLTPGEVSPAPLFRREFAVQDKEIASARIYMTALGSFALSLNGEKISEDYFSPGKLAYNKQLSYVTYDVTDFLKQGEINALGAVLLHGWYDRGVGYPEIWNPWGDKNALMGKMEIVYADGSLDQIVTDKSFLCYTDGPIREDDLYQGEFYDANYEQTGYDEAGFEAGMWKAAEENQVREEYLTIPLLGKANEPIVCVEELAPVSVSEPTANTYVYDFGQNFAGTCRIKVTGKKGQILTLRYGEELNQEELVNKDDVPGTIWTENLLTAEATDYYVLKGNEEEEIFEPEFVFHGFRYVQITGIDEALPIEDVQGIVLSSDLERTGTFSCSNELLNQYYQNTLWSQKSNFLDNPMDCPQRDERHGWAGDAQIFSLTAAYNMNVFAFYRKFLHEERSIQSEGGSFADMIPRNFGTDWDGTGGAASNNCWGDAPVVITWNLYIQYGDVSIVKENYDSLCKWVDMLEDTSDEYIRYWGGYGDHLSNEDTPMELSDTAWCAHSADLVSRMAAVLGREEEAEHYKQVYENFKQAWQKQFILPDGQTICNTQTSYALGLEFSMFSEELREQAAANLELLAEYSNYHINTGFSGIGYLLPALSDYGYVDSAYRMLMQEEIPSLLFPASKGATTNWEQLWAYKQQEEGYRLDGSLNHYAFGSPVSWLYTDVLGIKSDETQPGFKHILLEPKAGGGLLFAEGSYSGAYGEISVKWEQTQSGYHYYFTIPANTTATLTLPAVPSGGYLESGVEIEQAQGVTLLQEKGEIVQYELLSGKYEFIQK